MRGRTLFCAGLALATVVAAASGSVTSTGGTTLPLEECRVAYFDNSYAENDYKEPVNTSVVMSQEDGGLPNAIREQLGQQQRDLVDLYNLGVDEMREAINAGYAITEKMSSDYIALGDVIKGYNDILREDVPQMTEEEAADFMTTMENTVKQVEGMREGVRKVVDSGKMREGASSSSSSKK